MTNYAPLLGCYGGGHALTIGTVAKEMERRGLSPTVVGFTTAYRSLQRMGVNALSVEALVSEEDEIFLEAMEPFLSDERHPDITREESRAYYGLGFRELSARLGWSGALELVEKVGRKAFEPTNVMARFISKVNPDIVIATTSPRFELALLRAAHQSGIPSLAIADLFPTREREHIIAKGYAANIAVFCEEVATEIAADGFPRSHIRVTGNPAFDSLAPRPDDAEHRVRIREQLGLVGKTVVLWAAASTAVSVSGKPFHSPFEVAEAMERLCDNDPTFGYIIRAHPNAPIEKPSNMKLGILDSGRFALEDALLVADIVCFEVSGVGLQAVLQKKPAITVGFADEMPFDRLGLVSSVDTIDAAVEMLRSRSHIFGVPLAMPELGTATGNVLDFVDDILREG